MSRQVIEPYGFNIANQEVTFSAYGGSAASIDLSRLYLITDVTKNTIIYNFADNTVAEATVLGPGNIVQLSTLPAGLSSADQLQIIYDVLPTDPNFVAQPTPVDITAGSVTAYQGGPWATTISGSVSVLNPSQTEIVSGSVGVTNFPGTFGVTQVTSPWIVAAEQLGSWGASISNFPANQPVSGSVSVLNPFTVDVVSGSVSVNNYPSNQVVSGSVSVLNPFTVDVVSGSVSVSGAVSVNNFPTTQPVSGSVSVLDFPATQSVTQGTSPWVVGGNVNASQSGNWGASVSNFPATQTVAGSVGVTNFPSSFIVNQGTSPWVTSTSGSVSVNNYPSNQVVSGSVSVLNPFTIDVVSGSVSVNNYPSVQAVSGSVTAFPFGNQTVSGSVSVANFPGVQPVSQSGNWTASVQGQLPVTQATSPWVVSQSGSPWGASVQGTVVSTQGTSPWVVSAEQLGNWGASVSNFPATQVVSGSVSAIQTGTWYDIVSGSVTAIPYGVQGVSQSGTWDVGTLTTTGPITGQTTWSSGGAVQLTASSTPVTNGVLVQGLVGNTGTSVEVGPSGVTTSTGYQLQPGQAVPFTCGNANEIYIIGSTGGDGVCWTVL